MPLPPMRPHDHTAPGARFDAVDALRGLAMLWMTAFHFCFDLNHFGYIHQNFYDDPVWTWQRTCILSLFLFTAGMGQAIAVQQGQGWARFGRRWLQVAAAAALVTAGSWLMYPQSFIYFGTLHGIALMLVIARLATGAGGWLWVWGGVAIATKYIAVYAVSTGANADFSALMNSPAWNWLGWITQKPVTEDYVPLFPWLGVMLWGVAGGNWLLRAQPGWLAQVKASTSRTVGALAALGRWSLVYYLLHQPLMIGLLSAIKWASG